MDVKPLLGLAGVLIASMAAEFNDQVSAISLADISGGFGIGHDAATWVESLYYSAQILGLAISPWLLVTFTLRRFTLFVIALSCASSALIPASPDIVALDTLRVLQGLAGGMTIPLLMTTALRVLTPDIRLFGLAAYALTATFTAPTATSLAALWTDVVGWQFVFLQAIPFCTIAGLLVWYGMPPESPHYERFRQADWIGAVLVLVALGSFSTMLYQGDRLDWFNSQTICVLALISAIGIPLLVVNEWFHPLPLLKIQLLGRRNICYGGVALFIFIIVSQSASTIPLNFLSQIQGFRPIQAQLATVGIAVAQLFMLPLLALVLDHPSIDARAVSLVGLMLMIISCVAASFVTLDWEASEFLVWQALQAVGQPMVVMPLLLLATNSVKGAEEGPFASALVNTPRGVAETVGVWLLDLIQRWRGGLHYNRLADQLGQGRWRSAVPLPGPADLAPAVQAQAAVLTLSDTYLIIAALTLALAVLLLVLPVRSLPPRLELAKH